MDQQKIGSFIAENRRTKGFTQIEFAEKLGVSNKSVSRWETGKNLPDVSLFLPICDVLDISVNELIIGEHITMQENKKADEILVETIKASNKKLQAAQILIYIAAVLVNTLFMIGVPLSATPNGCVPFCTFRRCFFCTFAVVLKHQAYVVVYIHSDFSNRIIGGKYNLLW